MNNLPLTEKEQEVLGYIYGYISDYGFSPTLQEISERFKVTKSAAGYFVGQLELKGKIQTGTKGWRNIRIKEVK